MTDIEGLEIHEHEFVSQCCGQKEGITPSLCPSCRDWTGFECECGKFKDEC